MTRHMETSQSYLVADLRENYRKADQLLARLARREAKLAKRRKMQQSETEE